MTTNYTSGVKTKPYKAAAAFVLTFLGLLVQALDPSSKRHPVTILEWLIVIIGALVTTGVVYGITNPPAERGVGLGG